MLRDSKETLLPSYFKIWPLYFECSGAGTEGLQVKVKKKDMQF